MTTLVEFVAIKSDTSSHDVCYTDNIINHLLEKRLIDSTSTQGGCSSIKVDGSPDNIRVYDYSFQHDSICSKDKDKKKSRWDLEFEYGLFRQSRQLKITISSDDCIIQIDNSYYLEELKMAIKDFVKSDYETIIWIMDRESEALSVALYPLIYRTENLARQLINEIMTTEYGAKWWDQYIPLKIKRKYGERKSDYSSVIPDFKKVGEQLMSIDICDLKNIFVLEYKKWEPCFDAEISGFLNGNSNITKEKVIEILTKQTEKKINFWEDQFSKYLPRDFIKEFDKFKLYRNHVAHNKLINHSAYGMISSFVRDVEQKLKKGLCSFHSTLMSIEKQAYLEDLRHDIMESEAGVKIRRSKEIIDLYDEKLHEFYYEFERNFMFRNDIEIGDYQNIIDATGTLFEIKYRINNEVCKVNFSIDSIEQPQGEASTIDISIDIGDEIESKKIKYLNGEVIFNHHQGNYLPVTQDELDISDLEDLMEILVGFLEMHFENKRSYVDSKMYSILKDGENSPLADLSCSECDQEYICVDRLYGIFGQCLNCGAMHDITRCYRCGCFCEGESEKDEPVFCENCIELMNRS